MHLNKNLVKLHVTVLIWGFTAILGQLISKTALILVWYRMIIAALCLLGYVLISKRKLNINRKEILRFLATGVLVALHWYLFYYCIKISNIPVALVSLSSITLFTSILEPLINKRKFIILDFITGMAIVSGIAVIFHFESRYVIGTLIGLAAAATASLFTVFNARFSKRADPIVISFYEMAGGFVVLSIVLIFNGAISPQSLFLNGADLGYIILLSTICTAMAYAMAVAVMQTLSPITVVLTTSLEPVYGIILAFICFGDKERMNAGFYLGACIILIAVFIYPLLKNKYLSKEIMEQEYETDKRNLLE